MLRMRVNTGTKTVKKYFYNFLYNQIVENVLNFKKNLRLKKGMAEVDSLEKNIFFYF